MKKIVFLPVPFVMAAMMSFADGVTFVDCPKCDKRMRISEDGRTAFVNSSLIKDANAKKEMAARAKRYLELAKPVAAANPKTPLMGWSSWNTFAVDISEEIILGVARAMATNGLKAAGFVYVNIDDGFFDGHDADGRLKFHPVRFPKGMKGTVDGIHALGMKAGTYSDAGTNTCGSIFNSDHAGIGAGLWGHDAQDCKLYFNELGFDFIKVDYCGGGRMKLDEKDRYTEIAKAIAATGRKDVRFNICRWAFPGTWAADIAGSWRTTRDIRASWKSIRDIIAENLYLSAYAKPGHFNDLDMLEVGQLHGVMKSAFGKSGDTGITPDEETTHFGMWCMLSSPLVLGNDVRIIPGRTLKLVTNPFLLRVNQDPLGLQAYVAARDGEAYVLVKDAEERFGRSRYVALYNAGDREHEFRVDVKALDLGGRIAAFDLVERADIGEFKDEVIVKVRPHASRFFRFDAERRLERRVYEAETAYLTDYTEIGENLKKSCAEGGSAVYAQIAGAALGVAVTNLGARGSNDLIWKDVHASSAGRRKLVFRCHSPEKRDFFVQIDGGKARKLTVPANGGNFTEVALVEDMPQGVHQVRLFNPSAPMPDIDRMEIVALNEPLYAFRERLEQVHQRDVRDFTLLKAADEFEFRDGCKVPCEDFADFLNVSMGVRALVDKNAPDAAVKIKLDGKLPARQCVISVSASGVLVKAHDRRAAMQALFHLEDVMSLRRAPFLKFGETKRRGKFACRMTHAGWGADMFPDGHLATIAHAGFDTILFYVRDIDRTKAGKTDICDLIDRAEKWGLDSYIYSSLKALKHPDDPESDADMARSYGAVAKKYRKAKGFVIVPESCYFESRDPRVSSKTRKTDANGKPLHNPSRFPCCDYPQWLKKVESTIRAEIPDAVVVFWTYNFYWAPEKLRFEFIDAVTPSTTLNVTFALGGGAAHKTRLGRSFPMHDYSICEPGPSALFRSEADRARKRGLRLYTTSNTGGRTWDFGGCSFEPVPQQWKRRFDALCKAQEDYGLSGMIESHHYGFVPNFIAELAKEAFTEGGMPFDRHLKLIAARDFGAGNADAVVEIWKNLSEAIQDYTALAINQYGPFRAGPAYPFNALGPFLKLGDPEGWPNFRGWICNPNYGWNIPWRGGKQTQTGLDEGAHRVEIELFNSAGGRFIENAHKLRAFAAGLAGDRRERAVRQAGIVEYIGRSFLTAANIKAAALAERVVNSANSTEAQKSAAKAEIYRLAEIEYENTVAALPLVEADSHLGWECVNGYIGGRERIVWKLRHMEKLYNLK